MRVLRSSLFVAATAIIAAACGDKINLPTGNNTTTTTTTTTAKINSVLVAPNSATISLGQSVQLTAVVDADAGVTYAVKWTSSSATTTVDQTGLVAAGQTPSPGVAICATATAANVASKENCATIVVQPGTQTNPAVIQISSVTNGNPGGSLNNPVAVPPGVVTGQINVSVQLSPGTETIDSVYLLMNHKFAGSQVFTHTQSAALRSAANDAIASQSLLPTIVFSINTAKYHTDGTSCGTAVPPGTPGSGPLAPVAPCGTPYWSNGPDTLVAVVSGVQPSATVHIIQTAQAPAMLLLNADGWLLNTTLAATTQAHANAAGYNYVGGQTASVTVSAVPVIYTANGSIASASVSYGTTACDASLGAQRTIPLVANTAPAIGFAATFPRAPQTAEKVVNGVGQDVNNYEFNALACPAQNAAGGEGAYVAGWMYGNTTTGLGGPNSFALGFVPPVYRLDNRAPGVPTFESNPNTRQNGWVNAAVSFTGIWNAATAKDNMGVAGTADAGVGNSASLNARLGPVGAGGVVGATLLAQTPSTNGSPSPALLPSDQNAYCGVISATDLLGNESTLPPATAACLVAGTPSQVPVNSQALQFGLDIAPPTIVWSAASMAAGSSGKNGRTGASVLGEYVFTVVDTGAHGNSGMQATSPVQAWVAIHTQAVGLTALQLCPVGTVVSGVCTASATGFAAPVFPTVSTNALTAQTIIGYYTIQANAIDAAGNSSAMITAQSPAGNTPTRTVAYNPAANVPSLSGSIFNTPLTGPTATFTATGSSGNTTANVGTTFFDLWEAKFNLTYSAAVPGALLYPPSTPPFNIFNNTPIPGGSANTTTFVAQNAAIGITIPFYRSIQNQTSACNAVLAIGATGIPNALNETLLDQVGNVSAVAVTGITAGQVTPGTSYLGAPAAQQVYTFLESNGIAEAPVTGCPFAVGANTSTAVSGGGTSPDGAFITLTADVFGPTATFLSPFASVNFYVFIGGKMELIGAPVTSYQGFDDGSTNGHKFRYSLDWTPGSKSPISATAWPAMSSAACAIGATNAQLYALGISAVGDGLLTPLNQNICISTAP